MKKTHSLPSQLKDKIKNDLATIENFKRQAATLETNLQDLIGAYILGAELPQKGVTLDDKLDLVYEVPEPEVDQLPVTSSPLTFEEVKRPPTILEK